MNNRLVLVIAVMVATLVFADKLRSLPVISSIPTI